MNIAIIKCSQDCIQINEIEDIESVKKKISYQIENILFENITYEKISTSENDLIGMICKYLDTSQVIMSYNCFYTHEYLYQTIFIEGTKESKNINYLGTQISNGIIALDTVILIKNKILNDNQCELDSINDYNIKEIIFGKFIKRAINISSTGGISLFEFMQSPLEKYPYELCKNKYRIYESKIYNSILNISYEIDLDNNEKINEIGTIITDKIVKGNISVSLSIEDGQTNGIYYLDLDEKYFNKLVKILSIKNNNLSFDKFENSNFINIYRCIDSEYELACSKINKSIDDIVNNSEILNNNF